VMAVGRVAPVKRYDVLVRAAHHARTRVPDLRLHIVGDGYGKAAIQAVIDELDASGWVSLRGYLTEDEKIDLYRQAWIVASASAREGWGMTLTEAAACGTPAVATRIAGHADAVRDGSSGLLAEGDPESLGDAMADVLGDPALRARLSQGALEWAGELTWSNTATQLMRVVADEVSRRRSRR
jgi:glycosyltransferase involved in cell wall biosynthesis